MSRPPDDTTEIPPAMMAPVAETSEQRTSAVPSIQDAIGGPLGMVESALPTVVFISAILATDRDVRLSAVIATAVAVLLAVGRLLRGQTMRYAAGGLIGVAFAAFVAAKTGDAENFFLPGLLFNLGYAAVLITSIVLRRPLVGYATLALHGHDPRDPWHRDPAFTKAASRATWALAAVFVLRLAVQLPLYVSDSLVALGVAKVAMGLPLFALGLWLAWLLMRGVGLPKAAAEHA